MLSPLALATWISICTPWAEPRLLAALVAAGSGGEPYLIANDSGAVFTGKHQAEALRHLRSRKADEAIYLGLTQIPAARLTELGLSPEAALETCSNLEIGYHLFLKAHEQAGKTEKSPWKQATTAYAMYRTGRATSDSPFALKATEFLKNNTPVAPARFGSPLHHAVLADWSAGFAMRQAGRYRIPVLSPLEESAVISNRARSQQ